MSEIDNTKVYEWLLVEAETHLSKKEYYLALEKLTQAKEIKSSNELIEKIKKVEGDFRENQMERAKKNLVYLGMFSVFMFFAGFTSAYIVSMGDNFWVKAPMPIAFWISTAVILISSVTYQLAIYYNKVEQKKRLKGMILITLILGASFIALQVKGYVQLTDMGIHLTGSGVQVSNGRYGDYYTIQMDGEEISVNGNSYLKGNKVLEKQEMSRLQVFMKQFLEIDEKGPVHVEGELDKFKLYYRDQEMTASNGELKVGDSTVDVTGRFRLSQLARNIYDGRGDFFVRGKLGEDFHVYYKGSELTYKDRVMYHKGKMVNGAMSIKILESADTASSYLWVITFMHLLHLIGSFIYLIKVVIRSFTGSINRSNSIGLKMGALFWHFLGLLWVYLLLFLLFIH